MYKVSNFKAPLDSLFLVFLAIIGGIGFKLLTCPLQDLLQNNVLIRQSAYFIVILFTASFLDDGKTSPFIHFRNAFMIWIFLILFTKMNLTFTFVVFFMILIIYIIHMFMKYYNHLILQNENNNNYRIINENLYKVAMSIGILSIITIIIGFFSFLFEKKRQYKNKFDLIKFIFGVRFCKKKNI